MPKVGRKRRARAEARSVSARRRAVEAKPTPTEYVDAENLYVTDACVEYLR
ncbi:MAG: hypothetical protein IJO06_06800 [Thermoguttaceae bacterium]|nr:hypothetical protein [Thermoguttaceae bacterium]